ncbi:Leucine rich repeat [Carpediemonas membranifera]|uniref:Leucine rich repeat n=1 Tax=Carpediemonas membranifera TaxID=201153 RepID=A0A8J6B486_9EUKA|nr:Leucine rich repeat [Carpediemonas membranifera]|eukprot:KAG9392582.1 Leucine rich repeat [Carpediemonas membranifera]
MDIPEDIRDDFRRICEYNGFPEDPATMFPLEAFEVDEPTMEDWEVDKASNAPCNQVVSPVNKTTIAKSSFRGRPTRSSGVHNDATNAPARVEAVTDPYENTLPSRIRSISLFLVSKFRGGGLELFAPTLRSLSVMKCQLTEIPAAIGQCVNLHALWLSDNRLTSASHLSGLKELKRLYLNDNRLETMEGVDGLTSLQVLSMACNRLTTIESRKLPSLRCLNVASNRIATLDADVLEAYSHVLELNISGNQLSSFSEIPKLRAMTSLISLSLDDAMAKPSPISRLCNYSVYTVYNLRTLQVLDGSPVDVETRQAAEATYIKKRMYYLMRSKILDRTFIAASNQIKEWAAMDVAAAVVGVGTDLRARDSAINAAHAAAAHSLTGLRQSVKTAIQAHLVELDTGGNVRLERGKAGTPWFQSCVDLVTSRISATDAARAGLRGVRVTSVMRLQHRFMRLGFEAALEKYAGDAKEAKKGLEYLFLGRHEATPDLLSLCEHGMPDVTAFTQLGFDPAVVLSNSTAACDIDAIASCPDKTKPFRSTVLVCKVHLGDVQPHPDITPVCTNTLGWSAPHVTPQKDRPAVYITKPDDPKQRAYYFFDTAVILPEYIAEVEYVFQECGQTPATMPMGRLATLSEAPELAPMRPLLSTAAGLFQLKPPTMRAPLADDLPSPGAVLTDLTLSGVGLTTLVGLDELCPKLTRLNVSWNALHDIVLGRLANTLVELDVSYNALSRLNTVVSPTLAALHARGNLLTAPCDIIGLADHTPRLTELSIAGNLLARLDSAAVLIKALVPALVVIDGVETAPVQRPPTIGMVSGSAYSYKRSIRQMLAPVQRTSNIFPPGLTGPLCQASPSASLSLRCVVDLDLSGCGLTALSGIERACCLKRLVVSRNALTNLDPIESLTSLEEVVVKSNGLSELKSEWFAAMPNLTRLDVEQNHLTTLAPLLGLRLTFLAAGFNRLRSFHEVPPLETLLELYLGFNEIRELGAFSTLRGFRQLIILDAAGNPVVKSADYRLFALYYGAKLKVLDGLGVDGPELRRARATFEGRVTAEFLQSRVGRRPFDQVLEASLTDCAIREPIGIGALTALVRLDLHGNSITSLADMDAMPYLETLDVSSNKLESLAGAGLARCPRLKFLNASGNKLSSIAGPWDQLPRLHRLYLAHNQIATLDPTALGYLTSLDVLDLNHNQIRSLDLRAIAQTSNLSVLTVEHNGLRALSGPPNPEPAPSFGKLTTLSLADNRIGDVNEFSRLTICPMVSEVKVANNPVTRKHLCTAALLSAMPGLTRIDGEPVSPEDRLKARQLTNAQRTGQAVPTREMRVVKMTALAFDNKLGLTVAGSSMDAAPHFSLGGDFAVGPTIGTDGAVSGVLNGRKVSKAPNARTIQNIPVMKGHH